MTENLKRLREECRDLMELIERLSHRRVAYLALSDIIKDKREWVIYGYIISEDGDDGGFEIGRHTYLEAFLTGRLFVERLGPRGVLVEYCEDQLRCYHRLDQLRDCLHSGPDRPDPLPRGERIKELVAAMPMPALGLAFGDWQRALLESGHRYRQKQREDQDNKV